MAWYLTRDCRKAIRNPSLANEAFHSCLSGFQPCDRDLLAALGHQNIAVTILSRAIAVYEHQAGVTLSQGIDQSAGG